MFDVNLYLMNECFNFEKHLKRIDAMLKIKGDEVRPSIAESHFLHHAKAEMEEMIIL